MRLLSARLILSLVIGVTLVSLCSSGYEVWAGKRNLRADLQRRAEVLAESLAGNVERDLEKGATDRGTVRLLPSFDPFLQGHRRRDHLVDRAHYKQVYKDQGWLAPVVLLDGRVIGTWSYQRGAGKLGLDVKMFTPFSKETRAKSKEEANDLGRFLEAPDVTIRFR